VARLRTSEGLQWLEAPDADAQGPEVAPPAQGAVLGRRCPRCGWLGPESDAECFRCAYHFAAETQYPELIERLGVRLPPRAVEKAQPGPVRAMLRAAPEPLEVYRLRLRAEELRLARGFSELTCLHDVNLFHYPHQFDTALRALQQMRGRALLADEVGLGKTIEAGLIMKELLRRGLIKSVLVLVPASLTQQWQEELATKFYEEFALIEALPDWEGCDRCVCSLSLAKQGAHAERILAREWDLLIVDEAHKLKNRATQVYRFVNRIHKRYVLMLTATPVHNDLVELYSLITVLKPGQLGTVRAFRRQFVDREDKRRPKNTGELRQLLAEVMIRNRRSTVGITLPPRRAAVYHLEQGPAERALYDGVTAYIREQLHRAGRAGRGPDARLSLLTLQKELCSSSQAAARTLHKMSRDPDRTPAVQRQLEEFRDLAASIEGNRKAAAVAELLDRFDDKVLVFTDYIPTLHMLADALQSRGHRVARFHGAMPLEEKEANVRAFQREARVLVSSEAGGEGRNLQFCRIVVNYDLPWNPMRVEQRIGRVHRLGQEREVVVFNFSTRRTIEAHILDLLATKIRMFELVIGELDLILGAVDPRKSFEELLVEAWAASQSDEELERRFAKIGESISAARSQYERIKESEAILSAVVEA
jgi:SNF2 family DNA or RNA helicase